MPPFTEDLPFALQLDCSWCLGVPFGNLCLCIPYFGYLNWNSNWSWCLSIPFKTAQLHQFWNHLIRFCPEKEEIEMTDWKRDLYVSRRVFKTRSPNQLARCLTFKWIWTTFLLNIWLFWRYESGFVLNISPQYLYKSEGETDPTPGRG